VSVSVKRSDLRRIVVAIDPATTSSEDADDTGIVTVARGPCQPATCKLAAIGIRCPGHGYVLADDTCHLPPIGWARTAVQAYDTWQADMVVAEVNNGGELVGTTVRTVRPGIPYDTVTATRGKRVRAAPISALYEQGRIHHLGVFAELESQMQTWAPDDTTWSPDRVDALVWACTYLGLVGAQGAAFLAAYKDEIGARRPAPGGRLAAMAHVGADAQDALRPGCKHRFFTGRCVYCGGQAAGAGVTGAL
jgi:phage terminase large subunit-like protein